MTDSKRPGHRSFFQELKRRHVFGSAVAYIVAAWAIIQVADIIGPAFNTPDWTIRAISTVLFLFFPAFLVFSWEFDVSRRGLQRTGDDRDVGFSARPWVRRSMVGAVTAGSILAVWLTWSSGLLTQSAPDKDAGFPKTIAIDEFQSFTADESAWLGSGIASLVRDNLAQSRYLNVVSFRRWSALSDESDVDKLTVAAEAGITYLLQGEIIGNRQGHLLTVRLTDARDGEQLDAQTFEVVDGESLLDRATAIAQGTRARLQVPLEERVDVFAADFAADNPSAYQAFVGALDYWVNYDILEAERLFEAALTLQPDFAMARYYLAWNLATQDRLDSAIATLDAAGDTDNERDRSYIDALRLLLTREATAAAERYAELVEEYPNDTEARQLLAEAWYQAYDAERSLEQYRALAELEPELQIGWSGLAYLAVELGDFDTARPAIARFAALEPDNPNVYSLRGNLNRASGNLDAAKEDYRLAVQKGPELLDSVVLLATTEYLDGNAEAALLLLDELVKNESAVPRYRMDAAFAAGGILAAVGRDAQFIEYLDLLADEFIASEIFHAKALSDNALALLRTGGSLDEAASLADEAINASPGVATRYLLTRALVALAANDIDLAASTAKDIRALALPDEDADRTEDKAADFIDGMIALQRDDTEQATVLLARAAEQAGYDYRHYDLPLALYLVEADQTAAAQPILAAIAAEIDYAAPRLDLEKDRLAAVSLLQKDK